MESTMFALKTETVRVVKAETDYTVDPAQLPDHVRDHVWAYGLRQILNDAAASAKNADEAKGMADKRFANLLAGTLRASSGRESDPVKAEALRLATAIVHKALRAKGFKIADVKPAQVRELALAKIEKDPDIMALAKANVEQAKALSVDADDILGDFVPTPAEADDESEVETEVEPA
jgi:hypothetical protein